MSELAGAPLGAPPAPAPRAAISGAELSHRYAPGRGLDALDFAVRAPGVVAVTGRNGAGKSTLLRIVAGLLQPTRGRCEVTVDGIDVPSSARRAVVGYAAPELSFYDEFSVGENLRFAAEARGGRATAAMLGEALAAVGLEQREHDRFAALSSGLKQRVRLAFAVLHAPPILLFDEPGSHLDDAGREVVARLLDRQRGRGLALLATNDEREWRRADLRIELRGIGLGHPA